jgi:flagellin
MPQIINTNIASLTAQRNLNSSQSANGTALERLSSGLRINSAKDDAAGLAISTKFESQVKGLNVAIRNAGDGISLAQTAEGALGAMTENLQRIRELAVQSSNATNSDDDRVALQAEVNQLMAEVTRTADETNFNGRNLLDGSFEGTFQIGANAGNTVNVKISELTAEKLGVGDATGVSAQGTDQAISNGDLTINGVAIDPSRANSDTSSTNGAAASAIAKVASINAKSDETGVKAMVNTNVAAGSEMVAAATTGSVSINDVDIDISTGGVNLQADRESVISAINAKSDQTGVMAVDGGDSGGVILEAADGRNIEVAFNEADFGDGDGTLDATEQAAAQSATGLSSGTSYGGFTLISDDGSDITIEGGTGTGTGDLANAGLTAGVYSGKQAAVASTERSSGVTTVETSGTFTTGDFGLTAGAPLQINATNNTFELNVDGAGYQTVTLDGTYDSDGAGALNAGEYDSAASLADQINYAISNAASATYADNANLRDADGNALVTAADDGNGGVTFSSASVGEDSGVVARTGSGSFIIPDNVTTEAGGTGYTAVSEALGFIFDGVNSTGAGTDLVISTAGGGTGVVAATTLTLTANQTDAQTFADEVNSQIQSSALAGFVEATVSEDGTTVSLQGSVQSTNADGSGNFVNDITVAAATDIAPGYEATQIQHLSNGDAVITDPATYIGALADADTITLTVDGIAAELTVDNDLSGAGFSATALADAQAGTVDDQVTYLNNLFSTQAAGSGITASNVGGQIVLASDSGGSINVAAGTTTPVNAAVDITATPEADVVVAGSNGTATTGAFSRVSDGTDDFAAGTFLSTDYDGAGSDFEAKASALVIETGVNDTFEVEIDGGAAQTVTIAAGSYDTMDELSTAINSSFATNAADITVANFTSATGTGVSEYDFSGANESVTVSISLDGSTAASIDLADTDYSGAASVADAKASVLLEAQAALDAQFGSGKITAAFDGEELQLTAASGSSLVVTTADATAGTTDGSVAVTGGNNTPALSAAMTLDGQQLEFTSGTTGASSSVELTNGAFAVTGGAADGELLTSEVSVNALESGDLVLNGTAIGAANALSDTASDTTAETSDAAASGIATAAAINQSTEQTGVTAEVNATTLTGGTSTTAASGTELNSIGTVWINNVETNTIQLTGDADRDRASAIDSINALSGQTGVTAEDNGESITLTAADGRNISVAIDNKLAENDTAGRDSSNFGSKIGLDSSQQNIGEADFGGTSADFANTAGTTYSTVTLKAAGEINIENGVNGTDEVEALGLQIGSYGGGESGTYLADMDISTFEGAQAAISAIDNALQTVSSQRAELGALQNRFESTSSNLQITSENLSAANSRIRDADFAAETAELSRTQVLQQAGISILAQANQRPQQVLSLLG